jgi:hypothetical protein
MNLKQAEIILEKISRLYKSMKLDERNIDAFEQDLMLSYIRQLYESFSPDKPVSKRIKPVLPPVDTEEDVIINVPKPTAPKVPKVMETPKAVEKPEVVDKPKVTPTPKAPEPPKVVETPKPTPTPSPSIATTQQPEPEPKPMRAAVGLSPEDRAVLFEFKQATELSEKLSMAPIRDLTKAMGLNEKIFTINELFGGDSKLFDETIKKLNTFSTFDRAADYLASGVAYTQQWTERDKKKKALSFIHLVKRRYN